MRFGLGRTAISTYLPTLISKEIGMKFSALQPLPPWFPYSTEYNYSSSTTSWRLTKRANNNNNVLNQPCLTCFKAASRPESGACVNCVPNSRVGTVINNDTLRIDVALHLYSLSMQMREQWWSRSVRTLCCAASAQGTSLAVLPRRTSFIAAFLQTGYRLCSNRRVLIVETESGIMSQHLCIYKSDASQRASLAILRENAFSISQWYRGEFVHIY